MCQLPQQVIDLTSIDWARRVPRDHGSPAATFQFEPALVREHPVSDRDRVEVNAEIERELPDRWQQVAWHEALFHQMTAQIIGDLPIRGSVGLEVERYAKRSSHCLLSMYNIH